MICSNCHQEIGEENKFCPYCGTPVAPEQPQTPPEQPQTPPEQPQTPPVQPQTPLAQPQTPPAQPQTPPAQPAGPQINQTPYLVCSILVTLLCCLPFGIAGIIFATKINSALMNGDYAAAQAAAKKSKLFSIIGAAGGLLFFIIYFVLIFVGAFAGVSSNIYY